MATNVSTRSRILFAAMEEFADKGYSGASVRQIARNLGISLSLAHYHFKSKDDLYRSAVHHVFDDVLADRKKRLDEWRHDPHGSVDVNLISIFLAYALPHFEATAGDQGYVYSRLVRGIIYFGGGLVSELEDAISSLRLEFIDALQSVLVEAKLDDLTRSIEFLAAIMVSESARCAEEMRNIAMAERRIISEERALYCAKMVAGGLLFVCRGLP